MAALVFRYVKPIFIEVNGERKFRYIGIVHPVAGNAFPVCPLLEVFSNMVKSGSGIRTQLFGKYNKNGFFGVRVYLFFPWAAINKRQDKPPLFVCTVTEALQVGVVGVLFGQLLLL